MPQRPHTKITRESFPSRHHRPVVIASDCLEFTACRYNGERIRAPFVAALSSHVELRSVCPEVQIGLGVPRQPIRIVEQEDGPRLVQPATGRDLTEEMRSFGRWYLAAQSDVDGFILKSR